jgi:hypothetical protein
VPIAGTATAPTTVTAMTVLRHRTPEGRPAEGMGPAVTALLTGISCGSAAGGWCAEHLSAVAGFGAPVVAAWVAVGLGAGARGAGGARTGFGSTPRVIGAAEGDRFDGEADRFDEATDGFEANVAVSDGQDRKRPVSKRSR